MLSTGLLAFALARTALSIPTIAAKGSKLFYSDSGDQYYIKGVAYQLTEDDPLAQPEQCKLDAALMQTLGANAIRVYHVDASANHDDCMGTFADAGIYVWVDLDTFDTYITGPDPYWTQDQYSKFSAVMDAFHSYDNTAGFFVGNELLAVGSDSLAAPYLKAAATDMKAYRKSKGYREIPIGYSAADVPDLRPNLQNYLACGDDSSEALDFYSLNAYEWCGHNSFEGSGYNILQQNASEYNIPIFMSETGCIQSKPRLFEDQAAILGPDMDSTWSGAIIYEWIEETNDYGIISYGSPADPTAAASGVVAGYTRTGTPTPISPDFQNLANQWKTLSPSGVNSNNYQPSLSPPECPSYTSGMWEVSGNVPLPTLGAAVQTGSSGSTTSSSSRTPSTASITSSPSSSETSATASTTSTSSPSSSETSATASTTSSSATQQHGGEVTVTTHATSTSQNDGSTVTSATAADANAATSVSDSGAAVVTGQLTSGRTFKAAAVGLAGAGAFFVAL